MKINVEKSNIKEWLTELDNASKGEHYVALWKRVRGLVAVPARRRASVNLYKLEKHSKQGDNVIVPGKVLSTGSISHGVNIAAIEFSSSALARLKEANCKIVPLKEMLKAEKIRVII